MYKVFYNQKPIYFTSDLSKNSSVTPLFFLKYTDSRSIINALKDSTVEQVYLYHQNEKKIEKHFFKIFKIVEAAGGLVKNSNGSYLFIFRNKSHCLSSIYCSTIFYKTNNALYVLVQDYHNYVLL